MHFVCVGTPQKKGEFAADVSFVDAAITDLAEHLTPGDVVVGKSTVPAGTAARHAPTGCATSARELVWNPEFLREGLAVKDTLHPDRVVLGIEGPLGLETMKKAYAPIFDADMPLIVTDYATAELVKVAANSFLATKISFINAMAEVCEATGADVVKLSEAIGKDARIGHRFLHAGLGFGGGCLPKDIRAFMARAGELGVDQALTFLKNVDEINHAPAGPDGRPRPRGLRRQRSPASGSACSAPPSSRTATTSAIRPPSTSRSASSAPAPPCASTTRRRWTTPASTTRRSPTPTPRSTPAATPTSCCT